MDAIDARRILDTHRLFGRKTSRKVLNAITLGREVDSGLLADKRIRDLLPGLRAAYWRIRRTTGATEARNLPFYQIIAQRYPTFNWRSIEGGMEFDVRFAGIKPSLLSLLSGAVPEESLRPASEQMSLPGLDGEIGRKLASMFVRIGAVRPDPIQAERIAEWVRTGLSGEIMSVVSPVCPDYAVEDGSAAQHRFTFKGVGTGVGVAARRLFEAIEDLHATLSEIGIRFVHWVCPGDFEAFSEDTNERIGISEEEFLNRLEGTRLSIVRHAPVPVSACLFTDLCGGKKGWMELHAQMLHRLSGGEFGALEAAPWIRTVALGRKPLYDRWYDIADQPEHFYVGIAIRQGAEYAAMGQAIAASASTPRPLILGADDHKMGVFYSLGCDAPVLYLNRNYE